MIEKLLKFQLQPIVRRRQRLHLWRKLALCWAATALAGFGLLVVQSWTGWASPHTMPALAFLGVVAAIIVAARHYRAEPDFRWIAAQIEQRHPELHGLLLTAVQQRAKPGSQLHYLQYRLLNEAIVQSQKRNWRDAVPSSRMAWAQVAHMVSLGLCAAALWGLRISVEKGAPDWLSLPGITVTPGDTSIERGESLVVLARFSGPLPARADLVIGAAPETSRRIPLVKSLADPVFGGSMPDVKSNFLYHIEYAGQRTRDFKVTVFEHPRLERADAELSFPAYTGQLPRRIQDTRRLSAVEGSRLSLTLHLNKPVAAAWFVTKDREKKTIPLLLEPHQAVVGLKQFLLETSKTYDLKLMDADGRTNKAPAQFAIEVLTNRAPELQLAAPRGDLRLSALEEISFVGTVLDDFGVSAFGMAYALAGQDTKFIELGRTVPAKVKHPFQHLLRLEDLAVQPNQLISWFVWADDIGPDGQARRTTGDLFFGEVRPFEEIFREGQAMNSQSQQEDPSLQSEQQGNQTTRLADLQKQIISATWKLQRDQGLPPRLPPETTEKTGSSLPIQQQAGKLPRPSPQYRRDALVVRDSQAQALQQAQDAKEHAQAPPTATLWNAATKEMEKALARLNEATNSPASLPSALAAEQAAYQALLKLQTREYQVALSRNRNPNQRGNSGEQQMRRQLDQLDLTQSENRYETQRQARPPQSAERREQMQVMNRLQELARRQQDLNERLQELQTALQEARTPQEREEIRQRLKRLQESEQQMLAEVDELRQRMDRPENQARMADSRRQLDQTRDDMQQAAELTGQGSVSRALASATRAQRQLQQLRDEMRRSSSSEFAEDLRELRAEARDLARQQEDIAKEIDALADPQRKSLSDAAERKETLEHLAQQQARMTNVIGRATQVSQQAENAEPLLSRQLYDTLRRVSQEDANRVKQAQEELLLDGLMSRSLYDRLRQVAENDGAKSLELTAELLRQGYLPQADQAEQRARAGIDELRRGIERAAESVLGDDTEALRLARQELEALTDQVRQEIARAEGGALTNAPSRATPGATPLDASQQPPGRPQQTQPETRNASASQQVQARGNRQDSERSGGAGNNRSNRYQIDLDRVLEGGTASGTGPITGEDFMPWSDRLREVEEMLDLPDLRNDVASARERARLMRQEFKRDLKKPDWAVVRLRIVKPLVEVQDRIAEESARRDSPETLAPIDRDPVPSRYSDLVRRYYEQLGKDK